MIHFQCTNCGEKYEVDEKYSGKTTSCRKCKSSLKVPVQSSQNHMPPSECDPVPKPVSPPPMTVNPIVQVTVDHDRPGAVRGFFRAFGITSGVMAAIVALVIGIPVLACGGCFAWMLGQSRSMDTRTSAPPRPTKQQAKERPAGVAEEAPPSKPEVRVVTLLKEVDLSGREGVYPFNGLTATVNDEYIQDVRIIDATGSSMTADVLFENKSGRNWVLKAEIIVVNRYGVVLYRHSFQWLLDSLGPNKRHTESVPFSPLRFDGIFQYSELTRQDDFNEPKYLVVKYH